MQTSPELEQLALRLPEAARGEASPPLLFLGHDCTRAASVPDVDAVVKQIAHSLRNPANGNPQAAATLPRIRTLAAHIAVYGEARGDLSASERLQQVLSLRDRDAAPGGAAEEPSVTIGSHQIIHSRPQVGGDSRSDPQQDRDAHMMRTGGS